MTHRIYIYTSIEVLNNKRKKEKETHRLQKAKNQEKGKSNTPKSNTPKNEWKKTQEETYGY